MNLSYIRQHVSSSSRHSLLPLLLLLLLGGSAFDFLGSSSSLTQVEAVVTFQPEDEVEQELCSNNFAGTTFEGPICSPLTLLTVEEGCIPQFPEDPDSIEAYIVDADSFTLYCKFYGDVVAHLEDHPAIRPTLVVFPSPYTTEIGTLSEPFGDLTRARELVDNGDYALVVVSRSAGVLMTENRNLTICTTSDMGPFPSFFASPGWIAYQVIMSIGYGAILALSVLNLVLSVKEDKFHLFRTLLILSAGIMGLLRLLEFTIDFQNHLGRIHVVAWGFLNMAGAVCFFMCSSFLINAWSKVARHTLTHESTKRVLYMLKINVYIFLPICFLYLLTSMLRWGIRDQVPAIVPPIFAGMLLVFSTIVGISFLVLGTRLLLLVKNAITKDSDVVFRITIITMSSVVSILSVVIILAARFYYGVVIVDVPFASNMAMIVVMDLFQVVMGFGVIIAFSLKTLKNFTSTITGGETSRQRRLQNSTGDPHALSSAKEHASSTLDADEIIMDLQKKVADNPA